MIVPSKIVGGSDAAENSWPWQVSVQRFENGASTHICGGTIYNYEYVITAAHCVNKYMNEVYFVRSPNNRFRKLMLR